MIPALYSPKFRAFDLNGQPLVGGKLFTYAAGTTTPQSTYTDSTNSVPNTNPVILDSTGQANVFIGGAAYKYILQDMNGVVQWTADNITQNSTGTSDVLGGIWSGSITYGLPGAVVEYLGAFYLGIAASTAVVPGTNDAVWVLIGGGTPVTPLTITGFTGGSAQEVGFAVVNPAFAATYGGTPTGANITNTESIDSPHTLTAPYLSATLSGTFTHSAATTTTFTLHATDGTNNPTATQTITWAERIFNGTGTSGGATGATASGTSAVLVGDTGTLPSAQLGPETVGTTFVYTGLTGQYIYMLLVGGSHTFVDALTGFPFSVNAPTSITFVNQNGVSLTMFLYQSSNPLTGAFSPRVAT